MNVPFTDPQSVYRLTLQAGPGSVPPQVRLRRLLKTLLRGYGFRCLEIVLVPPPPAPAPDHHDVKWDGRIDQ